MLFGPKRSVKAGPTTPYIITHLRKKVPYLSLLPKDKTTLFLAAKMDEELFLSAKNRHKIRTMVTEGTQRQPLRQAKADRAGRLSIIAKPKKQESQDLASC